MDFSTTMAADTTHLHPLYRAGQPTPIVFVPFILQKVTGNSDESRMYKTSTFLFGLFFL